MSKTAFDLVSRDFDANERISNRANYRSALAGYSSCVSDANCADVAIWYHDGFGAYCLAFHSKIKGHCHPAIYSLSEDGVPVLVKEAA